MRHRGAGRRVLALRAALVVYLLAVARITLWPRLAEPETLALLDRLVARWHAAGLPEAVDVALVEAVANVVMFVPFGGLVLLVTSWRRGHVVAAGALTSTSVETAQLLLPERVTSLQDVVLNTVGAGLGVLLATRLRTVITEPRAEGRQPLPNLLRPSTLEPVELALHTVFRWGIGAWTVALLVAVALAGTGRIAVEGAVTCAVGVALGFVGLLWDRRRARRIAAREQSARDAGTARQD